MKWIKNLVLAGVVILASSVGFGNSAAAASDAYRNYGQLRLGMNEFLGDMDDADLDMGGDIGAAYGRYLTPYLVLEAAVDFFGSDRDVRGSTSTAGSYKREESIGVMGLLATIKGDFPVGPLRIFGGGGVGFYMLFLNAEIGTTYLGDLDTDEYDSVFGVHAVAGVTYDITQRFFAGLQALYRWTDDIDIDETVGTVPVRLEGDLNGYTVNLTAGFRF